MPPNPTSGKSAPTPKNHLLFDPWNSASSGHQRSDSNPGTAWQCTREAKLAQQFRSGDCTIESFGYDGTTKKYGAGVVQGEWEWDFGGGQNQTGKGGASASAGGIVRRGGKIRQGLGQGQDNKQRDIRSMMRVNKGNGGSLAMSQEGKGTKDVSVPGSIPTPTITTTQSSYEQEPLPPSDLTPGAFSGIITSPETDTPTTNTAATPSATQPISISHQQTTKESKILQGTTVYINGQTTPLISDHKLKTLLVSHGASLSLGLSRRVTHVIIGKPNQGPGRGGAGGGLAAGKIQKEIARGGWRGIRIVGVEWGLESVKAGKRLPETRFAVNLSSQRSVLGFM